MTTIADIIAAATPVEGGMRMTIPSNWLQGRTAYGGLSSALALHVAKASDVDLPPLRSALIAFVGPLAGEVTVTAERLRRGRNAAFIEATIRSEAGIGYRATFVFMADVPSRIDHDVTEPCDDRPPPEGTKLYVGPPEFFTSNFEFYDRKEAGATAEWLRWARLIDGDTLDPEIALIAIADALPPAALRLNGGAPAPVSSLTWQMNVLRPRPVSTGGWWRLYTHTDRAKGGYSSQRMTIWDADGTPVVDAMQGVAVFA